MLNFRIAQLEGAVVRERQAAAVARRHWLQSSWRSDHSFCFVRSLRDLQQQRIIASGLSTIFAETISAWLVQV